MSGFADRDEERTWILIDVPSSAGVLATLEETDVFLAIPSLERRA